MTAASPTRRWPAAPGQQPATPRVTRSPLPSLTRRTQAASAANQQSISRTQNSTGSSAAQQLTASYTGSLTAVFNVDGREMARTTASYMDEELGFRR